MPAGRGCCPPFPLPSSNPEPNEKHDELQCRRPVNNYQRGLFDESRTSEFVGSLAHYAAEKPIGKLQDQLLAPIDRPRIRVNVLSPRIEVPTRSSWTRVA